MHKQTQPSPYTSSYSHPSPYISLSIYFPFPFKIIISRTINQVSLFYHLFASTHTHKQTQPSPYLSLCIPSSIPYKTLISRSFTQVSLFYHFFTNTHAHTNAAITLHFLINSLLFPPLNFTLASRHDPALTSVTQRRQNTCTFLPWLPRRTLNNANSR